MHLVPMRDKIVPDAVSFVARRGHKLAALGFGDVQAAIERLLQRGKARLKFFLQVHSFFGEVVGNFLEFFGAALLVEERFVPLPLLQIAVVGQEPLADGLPVVIELAALVQLFAAHLMMSPEAELVDRIKRFLALRLPIAQLGAERLLLQMTPDIIQHHHDR